MSFIVYHIKSTQLIKGFKTESAAKRSTTCMNRNAADSRYAHIDGVAPYAYTDVDTYHNKIVTMKKVVNLMSGKEIEIPSNTPLCCDPSSETYWSM